MNKRNFNLEMEKLTDELRAFGERKKLLLHACCAPCSSACIERLKDVFDITIFFYNPNMDSESEFIHRATEQKRLVDELGVGVIVEEYIPQEFYSCVKGLEKEPEGGKRCEKCFDLRLRKTAEKSSELNFDYFATTLTVSPLKNAQKINEIGEKLQQEFGVKYLPTDFKKKGGYLRSIELSNKYNLYRQNYCGCIYSKKEPKI